MTLNALLSKFKEGGAKFYKPASASQIDFAGALLTNNGFAKIPSEYAKFLGASDGMSGSLVEFFGTVAKPRDDNHYSLSTVPAAMTDFLGTAKAPDFVIIGSFPLGYVAYSQKYGRYQLLDITSLKELAHFKSFFDVLFALKDYV